MFTFEAHGKLFWSYTLYLNLDFVFSRANHFLNWLYAKRKTASICRFFTCSGEASVIVWSCYGNSNHYHYSFLQKLIPYTIYKHRNISIACMTKLSGWLRYCLHIFALDIVALNMQWRSKLDHWGAIFIYLCSQTFRYNPCYEVCGLRLCNSYTG